MKKKIITLALVAVIALAAITGASLAYFTDKDEMTNTFTMGNVDITLKEYGKNTDGEIAPFSDSVNELIPGISVQKIATITNTGKNDAYVWAEILVPKALVSALAPANETDSALHYNTYGAFATEYFGRYQQTPVNDGILVNGAISIDTNCEYVDVAEENTWSNPVVAGEVTVEDVEYVVFLTKMQSILPVGKTTLPFLRGVYMDNDVDAARDESGAIIEGTYVIPQQTANGVEFVNYDGSWDVIVRAYAIQSAGFDTVDDAYAAYNK